MTVPCAVWEMIKGTGTTGTRHEMGKKKPLYGWHTVGQTLIYKFINNILKIIIQNMCGTCMNTCIY
jgi:hypothetical protein